MLDIRKYSHIVFDCDGVILDSNAVKSNAFSKSVADEDPIVIDKFVDYHKRNGGISRFVKFKYFFKILKKQKKYKSDLEKALEKYSKLSYEGSLKCELIPGIEKFLKALSNYKIDCFVISGGEQKEIRSILEKRNLSVFFKEIYGSPVSKKEHLERLKSKNTLYFGDAWSDFDAAKTFNMDFIYISGASEWKDGVEFCRKNGVPSYQNFSDIVILPKINTQ